ncbi:MAG: hypothetical protein J6L88_09275, partial [Clostridia bacterium]|nr:hypothetical protein [Clostridia bacterium]
MARPIDPAAAAQVTRDHRTWIHILQQVSDYENYYKQCVIQSTQTYAQAYAEGILQTIPVEEINRTHQGIRVKTLRDAGFDTIADLHRASKARLAAINGISDEGAAAIKQLTSDFLAQAKNTVRLRLSVDDQNEFASAIVLSVYQLKQTLALSPEASVLLKRYKSNIEQAIQRSEIAQRGLSWVFSSRAVKDDALKAYQYLYDLLAGKYAQRCSNVSQWLTYLAS